MLAAIAERNSGHPLGEAIIKKAMKEKIKIPEPQLLLEHLSKITSSTNVFFTRISMFWNFSFSPQR